MKRRILSLVLAAALLTVLGGCALFERDYEYSEPFTGRLEPTGGNAAEIRNYSMLKAAILDMINNRRYSGEFRFSSYHGNVSDDLAAVCFEVKSANPLGVFAVDTISYDTSRIVSYYVAEVSVTYRRTLEEIRSIHTVSGTAELAVFLRDETVAARAERAIIRAYLPQIDEARIEELLEELYLEDPAGMVLPVTAEIESYPREGSSRIFDVSLYYPLTETRRSSLSHAIEVQAEELCAQVQERRPETEAETALACAEALCAGQSGNGPGAAFGGSVYGALVERSADSRGIALAYSVLCRKLGLDCIVVQGSTGAMGSETHWWNILTIDGENYHADVSRLAEAPEESFLLDDDSLWGVYIWDTERYPACSGTLRYTDLVPPEPEPEEPAVPAGGEQQEPPAGTGTPVPPGESAPTDAPVPTEEPMPTEEPAETPPQETVAPTPPEPPENGETGENSP